MNQRKPKYTHIHTHTDIQRANHRLFSGTSSIIMSVTGWDNDKRHHMNRNNTNNHHLERQKRDQVKRKTTGGVVGNIILVVIGIVCAANVFFPSMTRSNSLNDNSMSATKTEFALFKEIMILLPTTLIRPFLYFSSPFSSINVSPYSPMNTARIRGRKIQSLSNDTTYASNSTTTNASTTSNTNNTNTSTRMRILYIVTSSSNSGNRFEQIVAPAILETTESLASEYDVDVYLVLGYTLSNELQEYIQKRLPNSVGIDVWNDAIPMDNICDAPFNEDIVIYKKGKKIMQENKCAGLESRHRRHLKLDQNASNAALQYGQAQLARQHRYVVKDKFLNYDFFMSFEDDMIIHKQHLKHHMKIMNEIQHLKKLAPVAKAVEKKDSKDKKDKKQKDFWGELSREELTLLRPGFIRVEVLSKTNKYKGETQQVKDPIPIDLNDTTNKQKYQSISSDNASYIGFDPRPCCHTKYVNGTEKSPINQQPTSDEIMLWETGIMGLRVRQMPELRSSSSLLQSSNSLLSGSWIGLLPSDKTRISGYGSSKYLLDNGVKQEDLPEIRGFHPRLIGQSAGWMASQLEILELNELCSDNFLPPFEGPIYPRDGLHRHNVEFWSGGIQLWSRKCNVQRIILLNNNNLIQEDDQEEPSNNGNKNDNSNKNNNNHNNEVKKENEDHFSTHFIYHSSNNKQSTITQDRLVRINDFYGQLRTLQKFAAEKKQIERNESSS